MGNVFSCVIPPLRHRSRNYDTLQSASQIDGVQGTAAGPVVEPMSHGVSFTLQELPGATNTGLIRNLSPLGFQPIAVHSDGEVTPALSTATTVDDVVSDDEHEDQTSDSKHAQADDNTKATAHASAVQDISGTASIRNELADNCLAKSDGDKDKVEDCHSNEDSQSNACPQILVTEKQDTVKNTADVEPTSAALEVNNDSVKSNNRQDGASPYSDL